MMTIGVGVNTTAGVGTSEGVLKPIRGVANPGAPTAVEKGVGSEGGVRKHAFAASKPGLPPAEIVEGGRNFFLTTGVFINPLPILKGLSSHVDDTSSISDTLLDERLFPRTLSLLARSSASLTAFHLIFLSKGFSQARNDHLRCLLRKADLGRQVWRRGLVNVQIFINGYYRSTWETPKVARASSIICFTAFSADF
jgi:hypothetical protein